MTLAGVHDLPLFIAAGLLLNVTPGADMALIGSRSALQGFRIGAAAALGVGAGCLVHVAAAALGLSALVASSATAFTLLRWAGAAYLVWLGVGMLRNRATSAVNAGATATAERTRAEQQHAAAQERAAALREKARALAERERAIRRVTGSSGPGDRRPSSGGFLPRASHPGCSTSAGRGAG